MFAFSYLDLYISKFRLLKPEAKSSEQLRRFRQLLSNLRQLLPSDLGESNIITDIRAHSSTSQIFGINSGSTGRD
jgi:hypothetical protein